MAVPLLSKKIVKKRVKKFKRPQSDRKISVKVYMFSFLCCWLNMHFDLFFLFYWTVFETVRLLSKLKCKFENLYFNQLIAMCLIIFAWCFGKDVMIVFVAPVLICTKRCKMVTDTLSDPANLSSNWYCQFYYPEVEINVSCLAFFFVSSTAIFCVLDKWDMRIIISMWHPVLLYFICGERSTIWSHLPDMNYSLYCNKWSSSIFF